jgi:hypothetical protein
MQTAARSLIGLPGGIILALLLGLSCAGALSGNITVVGRLSIAALERGYLPNLSGTVHRLSVRPPLSWIGNVTGAVNSGLQRVQARAYPKPRTDDEPDSDPEEEPPVDLYGISVSVTCVALANRNHHHQRKLSGTLSD